MNNNPLIDHLRNAKSIPERNTDKRKDGYIVPKINNNNGATTSSTTPAAIRDEWDYLMYGTDEQYEAHYEPEKKKEREMRKGMRMCFWLMLLGGVIMTVSSSVCAVYVGLTYHDVHSSYNRINEYSNPFAGMNVSDIDYMKDQVRSINHCITERYCKRIEDNPKEEKIQDE
jgi:hypothetical protein